MGKWPAGGIANPFLTHALQFYILASYGIPEILYLVKVNGKIQHLERIVTSLVCSNKQLNFLLLNKNQNWQFVKTRKHKILDCVLGWWIFPDSYDDDPEGEADLGFHNVSETGKPATNWPKVFPIPIPICMYWKILGPWNSLRWEVSWHHRKFEDSFCRIL